MEASLAQIVVASLLSSGFVGGVIAALTKAMWSPESKNELAKLGNDFAQQLLEDAKTEREELRLTIKELESILTDHEASITRLKALAEEKDRVINELERRQTILASKLQQGLTITLKDIFGDKASNDVILHYGNEV